MSQPEWHVSSCTTAATSSNKPTQPQQAAAAAGEVQEEGQQPEKDMQEYRADPVSVLFIQTSKCFLQQSRHLGLSCHPQ